MPNSTYSRGKHLHTLAAKIGMTDDDYASALAGYGVTSSKQLTQTQFQQLLDSMQECYDRINGREATSTPRHHEPSADEVRASLEGLPLPDSSPSPTRSEREPAAEKVYANAAMLKRLKFHCIPCAIHYTTPKHLGQYRIEDEILIGEDLRAWLRKRWQGIRPNGKYNQAEAPIPQEVLRRMYQNWINPTSNRFLIEGGYKRYCLDPYKCYYNSLTSEAVQYLITRFREMHDVLEIQGREVQAPII